MDEIISFLFPLGCSNNGNCDKYILSSNIL